MEGFKILDDCTINKPEYKDPLIEEMFKKGRHYQVSFPQFLVPRPTDEASSSDINLSNRLNALNRRKLIFPEPYLPAFEESRTLVPIPINNDELLPQLGPKNIDIMGADIRSMEQRDDNNDEIQDT
jgi:hypothetical protein